MTDRSTSVSPLALATSLLFGLLTLAGCGGGGGSDEPPVVTASEALHVSSEHASFNGSDVLEWENGNTAGKIELSVQGFHRGSLRVRVFSADSTTIYDTQHAYWDNFYAVGADDYVHISFTAPGQPGLWTIVLDYIDFTGHLRFTIEDTTAGVENAIPTAADLSTVLDPGFGIDSRAVYDVFRTYGLESSNDSVGRLVTVGTAIDDNGRRRLAAWRFTSDGGLDVNFGNNGIALYDAGVPSTGRSLAIDNVGRIYVTGWQVGDFGDLDMLLVRLTANGAVDGAFATSGALTYDDGGFDDFGSGVRINGAGRIVVAGTTRDFDSNTGNVFCNRYFDTGAPDITFAGGSATTANPTDRCSALALDAFGRPTLVGERDGDVAVWRFTTAGSLDPTFGPGGSGVAGGIPQPIEERRGVSIDVRLADGAIAVCGSRMVTSSNQDLAVWRFDTNGATVTSFGSAGFAAYSYAQGEAIGTGILFDGSDRLIIAGVARVTGDPATDDAFATVWRYLNDGTIDPAFAGGDAAFLDRRSNDNVVTGAATLQHAGGGEFYVIGASTDRRTGAADMTLWRIQP